MPVPTRRRFLLLAAALACIRTAAAQPLLHDRSRIDCVLRQMNVPLEGVFRQFTAQIDFNPARPESSKARIEIDTGSFDLGSAEANDEARSKPWFDARTHPKATFVATAIRALGGARYEARGALTIKGRTQEIVSPFTWREAAGGALIEGGFSIRRLQFNVGEGPWQDTGTVADEVQIRYRLALGRVPTVPLK
jgi:polyisoprenoid-binding protein YceI